MVDGGCAELDYSYATFYECDFLDNRAEHGNGGCLNVLDASNVDVTRSNFKKSRASCDGGDNFIEDDDSFVKCDDRTIFCEEFGCIEDDGRKDSTNCDRVADVEGDICKATSDH